MELAQIERRSGLTRKEFLDEYYKPKRPVVITDLAQSWPATQKWTFENLIRQYGHLEVPVIGPDFHKPGPNYMKSQKKMKFGDYLQMIQAGPTDYRIFFWNIFDHAAEMANDFSAPKHLCGGFFNTMPRMFFGGAGAFTPIHYDLDWSNNFHTHFQTRKHIILFPYSQGKYLYQHPFTVQSPVNPANPDYERFPALKLAKGEETILTHGETLFIPALWWHHIGYMEGGYSLTLRSYDNPFTVARGFTNVVRHYVVDKTLNNIWGAGWKDWKEEQAQKNAQKILQTAA
jgi:hypothetical protein